MYTHSSLAINLINILPKQPVCPSLIRTWNFQVQRTEKPAIDRYDVSIPHR